MDSSRSRLKVYAESCKAPNESLLVWYGRADAVVQDDDVPAINLHSLDAEKQTGSDRLRKPLETSSTKSSSSQHGFGTLPMLFGASFIIAVVVVFLRRRAQGMQQEGSEERGEKAIP